MNEPTVSVIVPNYNYARFLPERMESILGQTFKDYEIIMLDDASTDDSMEIIRRYSGHPKVRHVVVNEKNSGTPFAQWRRGFELARGRYIWIAEADDSAKPDFLARCTETLEAHPDVNLCITGSVAVDSTGKKLELDYDRWSWGRRFRRRIHKTIIHDGKEYVKHNLYWYCSVYNASATVFRRSAVNIEMFDASALMRNSGDWLFWTKLTGSGRIAEIYDKLNIIRRHDAAVTERAFQSGYIYLEDIKVLKYIERNFKVGRYRRTIRRGTFIKKIVRSPYPREFKDRVLASLFAELGSDMMDYKMERLHKILTNFIPGLMSMRNDRM